MPLVRVAILGSSGGIAFVIVAVLRFAAAGMGVYFLRRRTRRQDEAIVRQHEKWMGVDAQVTQKTSPQEIAVRYRRGMGFSRR